LETTARAKSVNIHTPSLTIYFDSCVVTFEQVSE
jgi:hypothetical protein